MKNLLFGLGSLLLALQATAADAPSSPPVAEPRFVEDTYFGTKVADPFRYFEDVNKDPAVQDWFKGQAAYARAVLDRIPGRAQLLSRLTELSNSASTRVADVGVIPGRIFYEQRKAGENQYKLYTRADWDAPERLLFDPDSQKSGAGGPPTAINYYQSSPNGKYVAIGVSPGGSEDASIRVIETISGRDTGVNIPRARYGGIAWLDDESGFFYDQLKDLPPDAPKTLKFQNVQVRFHRLGSNPANDPVVYGTEYPGGVPLTPTLEPYIITVYGDSNAYALVIDGVRNELAMYTASLQSVVNRGATWRKLFGVEDDIVDFSIHGDDLYVVTHKNAPRYKLLRTKISAPDFAKAETVIAPSEAVVKSTYAAQDALYVTLLDGGFNRLQRVSYEAGSKPQEVKLPMTGTIDAVSANSRLAGISIRLMSWTDTGGYFRYNPASNEIVDTNLQPRGPYDKPADIVSEEILVPSHDGVLVPLSIVYKKGLKLDGKNPCWLRAYGAYGIVSWPRFDPVYLAWLELGGIYATAQVRGGGAYGEEWHLAGRKATKPNTWKDLIACAQWLENKGYSSPATMGIVGGSAGGITVGRAMTERPDLFKVVVGQVGAFNTMRLETDSNGVPNIPEFGTFTKADELQPLLEMDAYQHVKDGVKYPATLLTTGMNDPRVPPWAPGKFAARLQQAGAPLVLLRIDYDAGHGIGSTRQQALNELADTMSFMLWQFGAPAFQPK